MKKKVKYLKVQPFEVGDKVVWTSKSITTFLNGDKGTILTITRSYNQAIFPSGWNVTIKKENGSWFGCSDSANFTKIR